MWRRGRLANVIVGSQTNTSGTDQPGTKEHIFTQMPEECLWLYFHN